MTSVEEPELGKHIRKIALLNAFKHHGKAQAKSVVGKVLSENPVYRERLDEIIASVNDIVMKINNLSIDEQRQIIEEEWPETLMKHKISMKKHLPSLPNTDNYPEVVTRFSPNPDCVLHLGSARALVLSCKYARIYKGKFILRFEDTDPKLKRPILKFYDWIRDDIAWLDCTPDEEFIQSDRLQIYYKYAMKLLKDGNAYICTCPNDVFRTSILARKGCECRECSPKEHLTRWKSMLEGEYKEGGAVLRVKTDVNHPNPAVRDWPAMRIVDVEKHPHPRLKRKYHVWPLYNLACGVDDHLMGVTHIIRGKEHLTNRVRQEYMYRHLGWKYPESIHYGRLKITGASLSKSKIVEAVSEGRVKSWDDPRLATFVALRRRGITPQAIKKMMIDVGPKTSDVVLSWENLYAYNRRILDQSAERYFFVQDPIELRVNNLSKSFVAELPLHPGNPDGGSRKYRIQPEENNVATFWVYENDIRDSQIGTILRLIGLLNVRIDNKNPYSATASFIGGSYERAKDTKARMIHWIPIDEGMPCKVIMPDATVVEGIAERFCRQLKPDSIIQFERFGFVRVDRLETNLTAYYAHK